MTMQAAAVDLDSEPSWALADFAPQPWMADAACAGQNPELFFPEQGQPTEPAKAICAGCSVVEQCLAYALSMKVLISTPPTYLPGVWGGTSAKQRKEMTGDGRRTRNRRQLHIGHPELDSTGPAEEAVPSGRIAVERAHIWARWCDDSPAAWPRYVWDDSSYFAPRSE